MVEMPHEDLIKIVFEEELKNGREQTIRDFFQGEILIRLDKIIELLERISTLERRMNDLPAEIQRQLEEKP